MTNAGSRAGARGMKRWILLVSIGLLATLAGLVAPRLLGDTVARPPVGPPGRGIQSMDDLKYVQPAATEPPDSGALLLRLGGSTVGVLGLAIAGLWLGRRWLGGFAVPGVAASGKRLRLVEALPLGHRCCIYLLQVDERPVLAGVDATGLQSLLPVPEPFVDALNETHALESVETV